MRSFDLVALGEVALDLILAGVDKIPRRWSDLGRVKAAGIFTAGSAGYVAQCYSKLGGRSAIVGRVGNDTIGKIVIDGFRQCGVSVHGLVVDRTVQTEVSTVIVYDDGNKSSVISEVPPVKLDELDTSCLKRASALHIGGYLVLPDLWGKRTLRWIKLAKHEGAIVSLDPQMSATGSWREAFQGILEHLDVLLLDEVEARKISGKKTPLHAAESLSLSGPLVALKVGKKGCIVADHGRVLPVKPFKTNSMGISTIGAGDAFDAAFIYGSLRNWSREKTARFANTVAALSTTKLGCITAIPRAETAAALARAYYSKR